MQRIGIFGGTFAPIHNAHLQMARAFCVQFALDQLYIIPDFIPPHKVADPMFTTEQRMEMTRLAVQETLFDLPVTVSDFEISRQTVSYTYDTLCHFAAPDRELYFLCGTDMFLTLPRWYRGSELFHLAHMVCALRQEDVKAQKDVLDAKRTYEALGGMETYLLNTKPFPLASTQIREKIKKNESLDDCLPSVLVDYIHKHICCDKTQTNQTTLPVTDALLMQVQNDLPQYMDTYRLQHTLGVRTECRALGKLFAGAELLCEDQVKKLELAGLLHDITKECTVAQHEQLCRENGVLLTSEQLSSPKVLHQSSGACRARILYGAYVDDEIYHAIACHTTGKTHMTLFDKLLFLADYIEAGRKFEACQKTRQLFWNSVSLLPALPLAKRQAALCHLLDEVILQTLTETITTLAARGKVIDSHTVSCYNELVVQRQGEKQTKQLSSKDQAMGTKQHVVSDTDICITETCEQTQKGDDHHQTAQEKGVSYLQ